MARETKKQREEREEREKAEAASAGGDDVQDDGDGSGVVADLRERQARREAEKGEDDAASDPTAGGEKDQSIAERAANGEGNGQEEEDDGQFAFEVPTPSGGRKITLGTFVPRGTPTEYRIKMTGLSQKGVGGLLDPTATSILLLADCVVESAKPTFTRDSNGKIEKCVIYVEVKPRLFVDAHTEHAQAMLHGEPPSAAAGG